MNGLGEPREVVKSIRIGIQGRTLFTFERVQNFKPLYLLLLKQITGADQDC